MKSLILLLSIFFSASLFASSASHICTSNPVALPKEIQLKTPKVDFVGLTPAGDPVYAHPGTEMLLVYKSGFSNPRPRLFYGGLLKYSGDSLVYRNLKEVIDALGISCGGQRADRRALEGILNYRPTDQNPRNCLKDTYRISAGVIPFQQGIKCCEGFEYNPNNTKCDEPQIFDPDLKQCSANSDCSEVKITYSPEESGGESVTKSSGCFSQRAEDLFNRPGERSYTSVIDEQVSDYTDNNPLKNDGQNCTHAKVCKSYNCENGVCVDKKVCRPASENENAPSGVDCEYGFMKGSGNKCIPDPAHSPYLGVLNKFTFEKSEHSEFEFTLSEEQRKIANEALRQVRALEWITLRLIKDDHRIDCFGLGKFLRENIGEKMYEKRKMILFDYTQTMHQIDEDFKTLLSSQSNSKELVTVDGQKITQENLASRQTSGYDSLNMMLRKANAQLDYETRMLDLMNEVSEKIHQLSKNIQKWKNNDKKWQLDDSTLVTSFVCEAKREEKSWALGRWKTKKYMKTAKRWETYYMVDGATSEHVKLFDNNNYLRDSLALYMQKDVSETINKFKQKFALNDPLNYRSSGDLAFDKFGNADINLDQPNGDLPWWMIVLHFVTFGISTLLYVLFSERIDETRTPRTMHSDGLVKFREAVKKDMIEHYKSYNQNGVKYFIYDPELINIESVKAGESGKDCLENINQDLCKRSTSESLSFYDYLEMVSDNVLAQYLTYSLATTEEYYDYFRRARHPRPKYFTKLATDTMNLTSYYEALVEKRKEQIEALQKVINGVVNDYGSEGGINLDGGSYASNPQGEYANGGSLDSNGMSKVTRSSVKSKLSLEAANLLFDGEATSTSDSSGGSIFGSAKSEGLSGISSAATKRKAKMKETNELAKKMGIDVDKREQARKNIIASRSGSFSSVKPGTSKSSGLGSANLGTAKLDAEVKDLSGGPGDMNAEIGSGKEASSGSSGGFGGISSGAAVTDPTGLSSEDKDFMVQNVERNPSKYRPEDFDNLFEVVSKAYARSLDRILIRKKPGEN